MPTSTSRGRYNWACPAALERGRPLFDDGFTDGVVDMKAGNDVDVGTGTAVKSKFKTISAHCENPSDIHKLTVYSCLC